MAGITRSPGKLILSGEHAVVQGGPALAMAVTLEATLQTERQEDPALTFHLPGRPAVTFPLDALPGLLADTRSRHQSAPEKCPEPESLLAACAALLSPSQGMQLRFSSNIPLGAGLGSSAAYILALLKNLDPALSGHALFSLAVEGENFQHGRSSGLDVACSLQGGLIHFISGKIKELPIRTLPDFNVYNSGTPQSSTGECVSRSREVFTRQPNLISDFSEVTNAMQQALQQASVADWEQAVRQNHHLLCELGVVPPAVQKIISGLEAEGHAAKVCGAGSVAGDAAGMVLVCGRGPHPVPDHWQPLPLECSPLGTRLL
jgi:mevalonate kinase